MKLKTWLPLIFSFFSLLPTLPSLAQTPEEKGLQLATEADKRDSGFQDITTEMKMILRNRHGEESVRLITTQTLEVENDGDKALTIFKSPKDVKNTALLTYSHKVGDDDQWLYLPALKRVKRISSHNKSGSFMGSEFSYEDIASQEVEKYTYKWIKDEQLKNLDCHVIERYPVDQKNSGYTRQVIWMDKDEFRTHQVEYYDRKNSLLKTLQFRGYKQYLDKFWRPDEMEMVNHQTGKSTTLHWSNYQFQTGLQDSDFTQSSLKRAR